MIKKPCPHGAMLPRGLRCIRGYLTIQIETPQGTYTRSCRAHTKEAERVAILLLNRERERLALGTFGLPQKVERLKFADVARLFYERHYENYKDEVTRAPRSESSKAAARGMLANLNEFFGDYYFDGITAIQVKAYRDKKIEFDGKKPASFNREKGMLSSIFTMIEKWSELREIEPIKCPPKNPCMFVPDLKETARDRVATIEELRRLREACYALHDAGLWDIIRLELETTLRLGDLKKVQRAPDKEVYTVTQGKTGFSINLPGIQGTKRGQVFVNFRLRWEAARKQATLCDLQFRDLRRTGAHMLKTLGYTNTLIKDTLGHRKESTTDTYLNHQSADVIRPLMEARRKLLDTI